MGLHLMNKHILYGIPHSLYTGRARSYLIKSGTPFGELSCGHKSFKENILPAAKLATIPVLVTPDGQVIRDGAAIIEHLESSNGRLFRPKTPRHRLVSDLFDVIGAEGLPRPAMHYRWNFPEENLQFLDYHFYHAQPLSEHRREKTEHMMNKMRYAGRIFGVTDDNHHFVESLYMDFLHALDKHLADFPYLLGWKPCIGDFGLIAPMFAHLGRDPKPLSIMHREAIHVYRWVERMNRVGEDTVEFFDAEHDYIEKDEIPSSLRDVLTVLARDFVPETEAAAHAINGWLEANDPQPGTGAARYLGKNQSMASFTVGDETIIAGAQPYRFFLLQRVQDFYEQVDIKDRQQLESLLADCNLESLLGVKLSRRLGRDDNLEVWL